MSTFGTSFPMFIFKWKLDSHPVLIFVAHRELASCFLGCLEPSMDPQYLCKTPNKEKVCAVLLFDSIRWHRSKDFGWLLCRENAGLLALTRVGSRRVVQISAGFMIFFSILGKLLLNEVLEMGANWISTTNWPFLANLLFLLSAVFHQCTGKFGAVFASIPAPIIAALYCLFFAYVGMSPAVNRLTSRDVDICLIWSFLCTHLLWMNRFGRP